MVGRTVVIGDIPYVAQCAEAFLSKVGAVLSRGFLILILCHHSLLVAFVQRFLPFPTVYQDLTS
jgi:hypothetical protein